MYRDLDLSQQLDLHSGPRARRSITTYRLRSLPDSPTLPMDSSVSELVLQLCPEPPFLPHLSSVLEASPFAGVYDDRPWQAT